MWSPHEIVHFWFGEPGPDGLPDPAYKKAWFMPTRARDAEIRKRFMGMLTLLEEGGFDHWQETPEGTLAGILLLDQFSRQIYRGTALAFGGDRMARMWMRRGLDRAQDVDLMLVQRAFFYMPLQHSERLADQREGVALYEQLVHLAEGPLRVLLQGFLDSAREHCAIIERFGRFPHRNRVLKRPSTDAERVWLADTGKRFGQ
ncbi:DUF924 family protein [Hahella sp. SMD15-11]|uniref:DUF924 family protein n=1 Tax=Thermohahella caldifontis TaxID=3142973 RepID=A0AB39UY39_9GAMM